ncbi:MAG: HNH endonuclease [Patescibacteria group bacterium]|nr:HNH endonuclease [Patescibacteria group bacterium]
MRKVEVGLRLALGIVTLIELSQFAFSVELKKQIREEQNKCCADCGKKGKIQIHHIVPQHMGGSDERANGVGLCADCHKKWDKLAESGTIFPGLPMAQAHQDMWKKKEISEGK